MTWIAIAVGLGIVGLILWFSRKAGKDAVEARIGKDNAKAAERIADAVGNSPGTKSDVLERLRNSSREL